jgi:hypothetical protein
MAEIADGVGLNGQELLAKAHTNEKRLRRRLFDGQIRHERELE